MSASFPRVLPVGEAAATLELGETIDPELNARVRAVDQALAERPFPGFLEAVPTYRSLLVLYDPLVLRFAEVEAELMSLTTVAGRTPVPGTLHVIPVRYGGEWGPDLDDVARRLGLTCDEVVRLHTGHEVVAAMVGFLPGFAYLGPLQPALAAPRLETPRTRVPRGSVGIAGRQTGIYPATCPGGWNLIGRTGVRLFDPFATSPALIRPGDRVRFRATEDTPSESDPIPRPAVPGGGVVEVLDGGFLTTVQDAGRAGSRRLGVGRSGPMDPGALAVAIGAVGGPLSSAGLEVTLVGPVLRFHAPVAVAVAGADLGAVLERADLGRWPVPLGRRFLARPGNVLSFTGRRQGSRAYVAFAGGVDVPPVLGSRATDLVGGFGGLAGRALRAGDRLLVGTGGGEAWGSEPPIRDPGAPVLRVVLGPQDDFFTDDALARFLSTPFVVSAAADRVGVRLEGIRLEHRGPREVVTDGMVVGSVQVPPDGQPIVMMVDGPTTGGYPKIATVVSLDLGLLAQLVPGDAVGFRAVSIEEAQDAVRAAHLSRVVGN